MSDNKFDVPEQCSKLIQPQEPPSPLFEEFTRLANDNPTAVTDAGYMVILHQKGQQGWLQTMDRNDPGFDLYHREQTDHYPTLQSPRSSVVFQPKDYFAQTKFDAITNKMNEETVVSFVDGPDFMRGARYKFDEGRKVTSCSEVQLKRSRDFDSPEWEKPVWQK